MSPHQKGPFSSSAEYALDHRCPTCKAEPGTDCTAPRKSRADSQLDRQHVTRQDAGLRHYQRDIGNAPRPEDRIVGHSYSTLKNTPATGSVHSSPIAPAGFSVWLRGQASRRDAVGDLARDYRADAHARQQAGAIIRSPHDLQEWIIQQHGIHPGEPALLVLEKATAEWRTAGAS